MNSYILIKKTTIKLKEEYDFYRLKKVKQDANRRSISHTNKDSRFRRIFRQPLDIDALFYVLAERLKKKDTPGKLHKNTTENTTIFNKNQLFVARERVKIKEGQHYYWIAKGIKEQIIGNKLLRQDLLALNSQFIYNLLVKKFNENIDWNIYWKYLSQKITNSKKKKKERKKTLFIEKYSHYFKNVLSNTLSFKKIVNFYLFS